MKGAPEEEGYYYTLETIQRLYFRSLLQQVRVSKWKRSCEGKEKMWQEDKGYQMKVNHTHGVYGELLLESKMQNLNVMLKFDS